MASPHIKKRNINTTILVDKHQPQIFKFDEPPIFDEHSIQQSCNAELVINQNTVLNIDTHLFYTKKIQIVAPKTDDLIEGQSIHLNLNRFYQKLKQDYFLNIPCTLEKVEKHQRVVHAVLVFTKDIHPQFNNWYQQWFNKHQEENKNNDIDESTFKFVYQYYKRINAAHLTAPVLLNNAQQIIHAFTSQTCYSDISFSAELDIQIPLSIFQSYISQQQKETRIPLYIWYEDNKIHYFSNKDHPNVSSKKIISWLTKKPMWRVLLLCNYSITPPAENQLVEINQYVSEQAIVDNTLFTQSFSELSSITKIINISGLFTHIPLPVYTEALAENEKNLPEVDSHYQTLSFQIKRAEYRFPYKTALEIKTINPENTVSIQAESTDISFLGFNLTLPLAKYPIKEGDLISINFTEWNTSQPKSGIFKKRELLQPTVYEVTKIISASKQVNLGVKRVKRDTDPKINTYIRNIIQEIQQTKKGSLHNDYDLYQSLLASLWINNNITGLNFFLGRDEQGIRIIQAIVSNQKNTKICKPYLNNDWSFLQQIALPLDLAITELNKKNKQDNSLNIGVYCYEDTTNSANQWHTKTDLDFDSNQSKTQFIQTALSFKKHSFYHCSLVLITPGKDDILKGESSSFVSLAAHRLKEINDICRALIAIGELNDVTRLITFMYK